MAGRGHLGQQILQKQLYSDLKFVVCRQVPVEYRKKET